RRGVDVSGKGAGRRRIDRSADRATPNPARSFVSLRIWQAGHEGVSLREERRIHGSDHGGDGVRSTDNTANDLRLGGCKVIDGGLVDGEIERAPGGREVRRRHYLR